MVSLCMIVLDVFTDGSLKGTPAKEDHPIETFRLETPEPPFHVCVQVGTLRWQQDDFG
jgi:hypothetical protein